MAIERLTNVIKQDGSDFVSDFMSCFNENGTLCSREKTEHCFWLISQFLSVNMIDNYYQQKIAKINETMLKLKEEVTKHIKGNWDIQMKLILWGWVKLNIITITKCIKTNKNIKLKSPWGTKSNLVPFFISLNPPLFLFLLSIKLYLRYFKSSKSNLS